MLSRLLILSLFLAACVGPVVAQSSADKSPFTLWSSPNGLIPPGDFHLRIPALSQSGQADPFQLPFHTDGFDWSHTTPAATSGANPTTSLVQRLRGSYATLAQIISPPCYSIRSYRFSREDPKSDSTRFADYSTCRPGAEFHIKNAVEVNSR